MPPTDPWLPSMPHAVRMAFAIAATALAAWVALNATLPPHQF